jgi:hypothetical protein
MSIKLTDPQNWSADLAGASSLLDKSKLIVTGLNIANLWNTPVNKIASNDLGPGTVSFGGSTPLPFAGTTLTVNASQGGSIGGQVAGSLFGSGDPFDQPVNLANKACLWLQLNGMMGVGVSGSISGFGMGIQGNWYAQYRFTRIFGPDAAGQFPPLSQAVQTLVSEATPPANLAALMNAPAGSIYDFDSHGSVTVAGSYSLAATPNPLATANVPMLNEPLALTPNAELDLTGSFEVSGALIFRVHKLEGNIARFHLFKKSGTALDVSFNAIAGLTGGLPDKDFLDNAFKKICPDSNVDLASREDALNEEMSAVLQEAISSHLSVTLNAEASRSSSNAHVFFLEVDLGIASQSAEMTRLVNGLFRGDWTLARSHVPQSPCVKNYSDMLERATSSKQAFRVHLLNLFSFESATDFMTAARVLQSPDGVVFTDHDTASRIQTTADGSIAEPMSLSKVLAQALQSTLVFKTGNAAPALVELSISGQYFTFEQNGSADDLHEIELLCAALDCSLAGLDGGASRVGVVKFDASSMFDSGGSDACFVGPAPNFTPKSQANYIDYAKDAIASLYDETDRFHTATNDDTLWTKLNAAGNPSAMISDRYVQGFLRDEGSFDGNPGNVSQIMWLYSLWYTVTFWSQAMANYAQLLQKAKTLAARLPAGSVQQTPEIQNLMRQLSSAMHDAQARENSFIDSRAQFGLAALYLSSGKKAANDVRLTWNGVTTTANNQTALAANVGD